MEDAVHVLRALGLLPKVLRGFPHTFVAHLGKNEILQVGRSRGSFGTLFRFLRQARPVETHRILLAVQIRLGIICQHRLEQQPVLQERVASKSMTTLAGPWALCLKLSCRSMCPGVAVSH